MAGYSSLFGGSPQNQLGTAVSRRRSTDQQQQPGQPTPAAQPTQAGVAPAPQLTFAQMQQRGQARPAPMQTQAQPQMQMQTMQAGVAPSPQAPPTAAPMPQYQGSAQGMQARNDLAAQAQAAMQAPTRYDSATFNQLRTTGQNDLAAQFAGQRQSLDETLAARGLYDSSIAANQYRDLGGQQARAMAGLDAQLLQDAAATQMSDRLAAAGLSSQLAQLAGSQDLAAFEANRVGQAMDFENQLRSAEFGEGTRQFDLQQQLAQQLGLGSLGLEGARVGLEGQRLAQEGQQFGQQMELSRDELALRGDLGQQEQELARARLTQDGTLRQAEMNLERDRMNQQGSQFEQSLGADTRNQDLNRQLQQLLGMGSLDIDRQRLAQDAAQFGQGLDFEREQFAGQTQQANLERQLREMLGLGELGLGQQRLTQDAAQFGQSLGLDRERLQQQGSQFDQSLAADTRQNDLSRALQERLGMGELSGTYQGADGQTYNTVARDRLSTDERLAQNDLMFRITQAMSGMTKEQLDRLMAGQGGAPPPTTTPPPSGGGGGSAPPPPPDRRPPSGGGGGDGSIPPRGGNRGGPLAELQMANPELYAQLSALLGGG